MKEYHGCGDHSCVFGHPGGMGTNAGCSCLKRLYTTDHRRVREGILALRTETAYLKGLIRHAIQRSHVPSNSCSPCQEIAQILYPEETI